jgi:hypothetical protein
MHKVILERAPHRENKVFEDATAGRALQRVLSLCALHGCNSTVSADGETTYVHAADWYAPRRRKS